MTHQLPAPGGELGVVGQRLADLQIVRSADWRGAVASAGEGADLRRILKVLHLTTRQWTGCQKPAPLVTLFMAKEILAGLVDPSRIERLRFKHYYVGMDVSRTATARTPCPLATTADLHLCRRNMSCGTGWARAASAKSIRF
ncbi:MAG: hypothetical protein ACRC1K_13240 [Planctomycetia bacterium]